MNDEIPETVVTKEDFTVAPMIERLQKLLASPPLTFVGMEGGGCEHTCSFESAEIVLIGRPEIEHIIWLLQKYGGEWSTCPRCVGTGRYQRLGCDEHDCALCDGRGSIGPEVEVPIIKEEV